MKKKRHMVLRNWTSLSVAGRRSDTLTQNHRLPWKAFYFAPKAADYAFCGKSDSKESSKTVLAPEHYLTFFKGHAFALEQEFILS